nr:winged helix-turn-helix domain-containing protein [uncultured Moellerella sp.]
MTNNLTFIINETLLFSSESGSLSLKDDPTCHTHLSKPASRLLKELIQLYNEKKIATRDELLTNVWENYGLIGSNNNLNTYISEIRKKIDSISKYSEFIITIPKKGFRLNGKIEKIDLTLTDINLTPTDNYINYHKEINKKNTDDSEELNSKNKKNLLTNSIINSSLPSYALASNNTTEYININNTSEIEQKKIKTFKYTKKIHIPLIVLSVFLVSSFWLTGQFYTYTSIKIDEKINKIDNCTIETIDRTNKTLSYRDLEIIKMILDKNNIDCAQDEKIILSPSDHLTAVDTKDIYLKVCNEINECTSITGK